MKKLVLAAILALIVIPALAQWGVVPDVALNVPSYKLSPAAALENKVGYRLGLSGYIGVLHNVYVQAGISLNSGGFKLDKTGVQKNVASLQFPITLMYKTRMNDKTDVFFNGGVFLARNVFGKLVNNLEEPQMIKIGDAADADIMPIETGWLVNAGVQLSSDVILQVYYQTSTNNLSPVAGSTLQRSQSGISVGYVFNKTTARKFAESDKRNREEKRKNRPNAPAF